MTQNQTRKRKAAGGQNAEGREWIKDRQAQRAGSLDSALMLQIYLYAGRLLHLHNQYGGLGVVQAGLRVGPRHAPVGDWPTQHAS